MFVFTALLGLFLIISQGLSFPEGDTPDVDPEYLDMLLETNQHEVFSKLMGIENVNLVRPSERARSENPKYHKELKQGDILPSRKRITEEDRQLTRFDNYPDLKWEDGYVPYAISRKYTQKQKQIILDAIDRWNEEVYCIEFLPRTNERNYVFYFSGDGCYSNMGRTGGQQPISMDVDGCLDQGTILHEMEHAIGIAHEHNRQDRDKYIKMLWDNILDDWKDQFDKTDPEEYRDAYAYDYYSLMHYDTNSPDTDKKAFEVRDKSVDENKVGKADDFTGTDLDKIEDLYCDEFRKKK